MKNQQKTIINPFTLSGVGLHKGVHVNVHFKPALANEGIRFVRVDLPQKPVIKLDEECVVTDPNVTRCTAISHGDVMIVTVEHLTSVLCGLGIDNLTIEIDGDELPGLDGSGLEYFNAFKKAGIQVQEAPRNGFRIQEPIGVAHNGSSLLITPADDFKISYTLNYDHPNLKSQFFSTVLNGNTFEKEIVACRTFVLESEANDLVAQGLGKGANYNNTLVVGHNGVVKNKLRFEDEFVRHKILDCIGDLYLLGFPIYGHVFATKSGHALNRQLLKKIAEQKRKYESQSFIYQPFIPQGKDIDVGQIMKILPHRYPFLLVDKVIEIEMGKRAIGIKNVTINDNFFQGHFPTRPIMPGVLMVEAMAQTAGVVVLTNPDHHGKVAFFMAVDNVKFRRVVVPGDQLVMEVEVIRDRSRTTQVKGTAKVDGEVAAEAEMVFSFIEADYLNPQ
ncbi:MAG: UDP-3-O-[3-hydroxymyristoyl] N-acetylglucosamine deacetylase [Candidatus Omnitrophica bacterium]|nr:UDP-3-O-[3-hydroxymyristoyl] N-acetylglucosamine deacetylase [Candidatus Omnitrophota bacterium]